MIRTGLAVRGFLFAYECTLAQSDAVVEVKARGSFDDVKQMLVLSIENRGLVINHQSAILDREHQHLLDVVKAAASLHLYHGVGLRERAAIRKEKPNRGETSSNHVVPSA